MPISRRARTICRAITEPSRSFVEANDSLSRRMLVGRIWPMIALILLSSSSSFPLFINSDRR